MTMIPRSAHARASAPSHLPSNDDRPWAREGCATTGHPPAEAAEEEAKLLLLPLKSNMSTHFFHIDAHFSITEKIKVIGMAYLIFTGTARFFHL